MTATAEPGIAKSTASNGYHVIGTRPIRPDGEDKVTGRARYAADIQLPGMLHGKVLRSPHAHARILAIDTSKAEALTGVKAVVTARDFPIIENTVIDLAEANAPARNMAENTLAADKALYRGHAVAAVAAIDAHIAEEALSLIDVQYEVLPAAVTVDDAMRPDAPMLFDQMTTRFRVDRFSRGDDTGQHSNIAGHMQLKRGDVEQGFREADVVVDREFRTETVHQGYLEPHSSTALWHADGEITIWTSTQATFTIRAVTAAILAVPESNVRVIPLEIGGGFGGKLSTYIDPVVAKLSQKSGGKPVKISMTRKEVFEGTGPASGTFMRCKVGATKDGRITAAELSLAFEAGAYPGSAVGGGVLTALAPYKLDNLLVDGYDVVCNKQRAQAYRAPGHPQANFAVEPVMDELAERLGLEPLEFRMRNAVEEGDRNPAGIPFPRIGYKELLETMRSHPHYNAPIEGPNRGRGVSVGYRINAGNRSTVTLSLNVDGKVNVVYGAVDIGGSRAAMAMMAAESLGIEVDDVHPLVVDTSSIGFAAPTGGSGTTYDTGLAIYNAARELKRRLTERAALLWDVDPAEVHVEEDQYSTGDGDARRSASFQELAGKMMTTGGPIFCSAVNDNTEVGPIFGGAIADVEVDPETGKVDILRYTAFMDAGRAIHPSYAEGQLRGGAVQGIGWALHEEYVYNDAGQILNPTLLDYRMPTTLDVPWVETVLVEVPNPKHPFGVRGVGEIPIVPPMSAIANAIHNAIGVRLQRLPMKPGAILEALAENGSG